MSFHYSLMLQSLCCGRYIDVFWAGQSFVRYCEFSYHRERQQLQSRARFLRSDYVRQIHMRYFSLSISLLFHSTEVISESLPLLLASFNDFFICKSHSCSTTYYLYLGLRAGRNNSTSERNDSRFFRQNIIANDSPFFLAREPSQTGNHEFPSLSRIIIAGRNAVLRVSHVSLHYEYLFPVICNIQRAAHYASTYLLH